MIGDRTTLKIDSFVAMATAGVAGILVVLFLGLFAGGDFSASEKLPEESGGRTRETGRNGEASGGNELVELVIAQKEQGSSSPRVDVSDKIALIGKGPLDSPKSLLGDDVESALVTKESAGKMTGIRRRLLLEAAERALFSKTPWSDLSIVSLGFLQFGDEEAARYWFLRAARLAQDPDNPEEASVAMSEVVRHMLSAKFYQMAQTLISRIPMTKYRGRAKAELVSAYARIRKFEAARILAAGLNDAKAKGLAYGSIAESEARYLEFEEVLETLTLIPGAAEKNLAYGRIALIMAGLGDADSAMLLVNRIKDSRLRDLSLVRLASVQSKGGSFSFDALVSMIRDPFFKDQAAIGLISNEGDRRRVNLVSAAAERIKSPQEKEKAYEALVNLQIRYGDLAGALDRAQAIGAEDVRNRALQAVAIAEVRKSGVDAARKVAELIINDEDRESAYRKLAQQAAVAGQSAGAVDTVNFIDSPSERALAYASIALTRARYGDDEGARQLVQDANRELDQVISPRDQAQAAGVVAEVFAYTGDFVSAFDAAASISNAGLRDQTYQRLALSFANSQEADLAERSANFIERESTREKTLDSVALTLAKRVSITDALDYAEALDSSRQQVRFLVGVAGRKS